MNKKLEEEINEKLNNIFRGIEGRIEASVDKRFASREKAFGIKNFTELVKEFFVPAIKELLRSELDKIKNIEGKVEYLTLKFEGLKKENQIIKAGIGRKIFDHLSKEK